MFCVVKWIPNKSQMLYLAFHSLLQVLRKVQQEDTRMQNAKGEVSIREGYANRNVPPKSTNFHVVHTGLYIEFACSAHSSSSLELENTDFYPMVLQHCVPNPSCLVDDLQIPVAPHMNSDPNWYSFQFTIQVPRIDARSFSLAAGSCLDRDFRRTISRGQHKSAQSSAIR
jgi:hypothetical protein